MTDGFPLGNSVCMDEVCVEQLCVCLKLTEATFLTSKFGKIMKNIPPHSTNIHHSCVPNG